MHHTRILYDQEREGDTLKGWNLCNNNEKRRRNETSTFDTNMNGFVRILYDDHRPKRQSHVVHATIRYDLYLTLATFTFTFPITDTSTAIFPQEYHDDLILMIT